MLDTFPKKSMNMLYKKQREESKKTLLFFDFKNVALGIVSSQIIIYIMRHSDY